jgi:hypothetical protein
MDLNEMKRLAGATHARLSLSEAREKYKHNERAKLPDLEEADAYYKDVYAEFVENPDMFLSDTDVALAAKSKPEIARNWLTRLVERGELAVALSEDEELLYGGTFDLTEASEVELDELSPAKQKAVKNVSKAAGMAGNEVQVWDGIHGVVLDFHGEGDARLSRKMLMKILFNKDVRWIQSTHGSLSIGM